MGYCSDIFTRGRGMMGGGMFGMGIIWWILIAIVIIGAVYILRDKSSRQTGVSHSSQPESADQTVKPSALDILDEEFAKGNITEEEYLHKKEILKK